jgi:hypothetical protein
MSSSPFHQRLRVVVDPDPAQLGALGVDPSDHRPVQMQIDSDDLPTSDTVAHGGLPSLMGR